LTFLGSKPQSGCECLALSSSPEEQGYRTLEENEPVEFEIEESSKGLRAVNAVSHGCAL
jgi:cold shock CspA family protein